MSVTNDEGYVDREKSAWWSEEMQRCEDKIAPMVEAIEEDDDMQLKSRGKKVKLSGKHEMSLRFYVEGEDYSEK